MHLQKMHIHDALDLIFHLPHRYEDRTRITPIKEARIGNRVLIEGAVVSAGMVGHKQHLLVNFADDSGFMNLRFIHYASSYKNRMQPGQRLCCFGEVRAHFPSGVEMVHPEFTELKEGEVLPLVDTLTPIYPTTKGLAQKSLRKLIAHALDYFQENKLLPELLPEKLLEKYSYPTLFDALLFVHQPPKTAAQLQLLAGTHPMQQRLAFEELTAHNLSLQKIRLAIQKHHAPAISKATKLTQQLLQQLPFQLTNAQSRVIAEIAVDLAKHYPMLRLVQGDVGSGKTLVAAMSALQVIEQGYQVALMAPTEILAEQHLTNFSTWFAPLNIELAFLTGKMTGKSRHEQLDKISSGFAKLIIGTHALFQESVNFANLALVIVDEQHRFGVHQRLALKEKADDHVGQPHQLIMTATPIPRTLAMTAYADLDCSIIDELPPGRKPIQTVLIENSRRNEVIERLKINCENRCQAYWICTLIEESETLQCQAAENTQLTLAEVMPNVRVGLVHGRMSSDEKEKIMQQFNAHEIDVLVATTVVEVGVDVPNASLMIIENPERLGLSQLHQLRGRVGRGERQSHCVLLYQLPLGETAKMRLQIMRETQDGFVIAQKDLSMRGPGEVLGTKQSGLMRFRIADIIRDNSLLDDVNQLGQQLTREYPELVPSLIERWIKEADRYGAV